MKTLTKKNPKLKKVIDKLKIVSFDPKNPYHAMGRRMNSHSEASREGEIQEMKREAKLEGEAVGIEKGIALKAIKTVLNMTVKNQSLDFIAEVTELSILEIIAIQKKHIKK